MKKSSFRNVKFSMEPANGYGQYFINAIYRGKALKIHTTNSQAWDWLDDDSNKEKQDEARRYCYNMIVDHFFIS